MILNHQNWPTFSKKRWFASPRICIQVLSMSVCRKDSQPPKLTYFFKKTLVFQPKNLQFFLMGCRTWKNINNLRDASLGKRNRIGLARLGAEIWAKMQNGTIYGQLPLPIIVKCHLPSSFIMNFKIFEK